jgi:succinate-semialdehyde dehydrogenase / glutarate-semialdehyde dehydrogenase
VTPLSPILARELLIDAGLPAELFQLVHGAGSVGAELIKHVDYVGFTGGTVTGRKIAAVASERLIPFSLELGGKNPMIVLEGAPLDDAATGLISGAFTNSGQTCIAIERVYVQDSIYSEFVSRLVAQTQRLKLGYSKSWETDIGSLISVSHAEKVMHHIEQAREAGASITVGGKRRHDLGPAFVEPTILENVPESTPAFCDETFGPVVALYRVQNADEAVARANDSRFGLNASVWTGDSATSRAVAQRLDTGSVAINSTLLIYNTFDIPMGGVKQSGIGRRHGEQGILRYMRPQSIVSSMAAGGGYDSLMLRIDRPGRVRTLLRALRMWRRIPWI